MEINNIKNSIRNGENEFIITYFGGQKRKLRLFISTNDELCFYGKGMRKRGFKLWLGNIFSIEPIKKRNKYAVFRERAAKCERYLAASGLWSSLRECMVIYKHLSDVEIMDIEKDVWNNSEKYGLKHFNVEVFFNLLSPRSPFLSINLYKSVKADVTEKMRLAIKENKDFSYVWRKGYDNSVEIRKHDDELCGWYSNEYKGCGNGYYHFLLDEKHALYGEKD